MIVAGKRRHVPGARSEDILTPRTRLRVNHAEDGGTRAAVVTDLQLTGRVARMGPGIVEDVSKRLLGEFAACLSQKAAAEASTPPERTRPIGGLRLIARLVGARLRRLFRG